MNTIGLLDFPTKGEYYFFNKKIYTLSDSELSSIRNQNIGYIFQSFNLISNLNSYQNVELPLIYRGVPKKEREILSLDTIQQIVNILISRMNQK